MMPPGGAPPPGGQFQATPGKQGSGFKYALIGCGCLALIGVAIVVFVLATGGFAAYMGHRALKSGGADCAAAEACCKKIMAKSGSNDAACTALENAPALACTESLKTYKQSATALGISCP